MSPLRKLVTGIGIAIALGFIAYPSWTEVYTAPAGGFSRINHGYHFLWNKPADIQEYQSQGVRIHSSELSPKLILIAILTIAANLVIKSREKNKHKKSNL